MERNIIGICGPLSCGKSTVAKLLCQNHGYVRHFFAKPLKEMLKCAGLTEEHVNGSLKEVPCDILGGKTPRYAMQTLGTEWARELIHKNFWVNAWEASLPEHHRIVVDDLRFPNELKRLKELGALIIEVNREGVSRTGHASETFEIDGDVVIHNNGTIEELEQKVSQIIQQHNIIYPR
jgi:hypothetical protein